MIVTCESCNTKFNLDDTLLKESGTKVRCSNCRHIFKVYRPAITEEPELEPAVEEGIDYQSGDMDALAASLPDEEPVEEEVPEAPEEPAEEALDFDLFESEEEGEEQEISLADLDLEEDTPLREAPGEEEELFLKEDLEEKIALHDVSLAEEVAGEQMAAEEQAPLEEIGEETQTEAEEELSLEDLGLDEDAAIEGLAESVEELAESEQPEEEISLEDLGMEEEAELEGAAETTEELVEAQETEEEILLEDLGLEEEATLESEPAGEGGIGEEPEEEASVQYLTVEEEFEAEEEPVVEEVTLEETVGVQEGVDVASAEAVSAVSIEEDEEKEAKEPAEAPPLAAAAEKKPAARKPISTPLLILLILVLIGGGAYVGYTVLKSRGIRIPFLESLIGGQKSETVDPGNMNITLIEHFITSEFVDNRTSGRLLVIKGKIRNDYPDARNFIKVKGAIYLKDGKVAKDYVVYCGNVLSDNELQTLDMESINKKLGNRFGEQKSNFRVPPGKVIPFMVVFSNVPKDLGEFSVEVVGSVSGLLKR